MTITNIERELAAQTGDKNMYFQHYIDGTGKFLWFDTDSEEWCVNSYATQPDGTVTMSPMPFESFSKAL